MFLVACGPDAKFRSACNKITANVCEHQVECGIQSDVFECQREFEDSFSCDPDATVEQLQTCADAAKAVDCPTSIPFLCFDVLCDRVAGCDVEVPTPPLETGGTGARR